MFGRVPRVAYRTLTALKPTLNKIQTTFKKPSFRLGIGAGLAIYTASKINDPSQNQAQTLQTSGIKITSLQKNNVIQFKSGIKIHELTFDKHTLTVLNKFFNEEYFPSNAVTYQRKQVYLDNVIESITNLSGQYEPGIAPKELFDLYNLAKEEITRELGLKGYTYMKIVVVDMIARTGTDVIPTDFHRDYESDKHFDATHTLIIPLKFESSKNDGLRIKKLSAKDAESEFYQYKYGTGCLYNNRENEHASQTFPTVEKPFRRRILAISVLVAKKRN